MRVLITGATGLIGSQIVKDCHSKGINVNYLTTSKSKLEKADNYKGFYWDPYQGEIDEDCFYGVSSIIHLVGASIAERWTDAYKDIIIKSRVQTTGLLVEVLGNIDHEITHVVSASAIGYYPDSLHKIYDETEQEINSSFLGKVVVKWESAVDKFMQVGIKVAKVRIGVVMAKEGGALQKLMQPVKYYAGAPLGSGKQWQSWIHINDLSRLFIYISQHSFAGIFNGVSPNPVTNERLTKEIASVLEKPIILPKVPAFMLKLMLGEMSAVVLESQLISSNKIESEGFEFDYTNITKALQDLLK
ncbi:TIGR01777 family oxidoreductase [Gangjinia marincola]|uniref:TIGR01777 family oxidoreductase n=1 Tax=Gangjinia marincola TaxID=578463 RepID=A0ABP3XPZ1_9FLAO